VIYIKSLVDRQPVAIDAARRVESKIATASAKMVARDVVSPGRPMSSCRPLSGHFPSFISQSVVLTPSATSLMLEYMTVVMHQICGIAALHTAKDEARHESS
jgi:hypothetical protein